MSLNQRAAGLLTALFLFTGGSIADAQQTGEQAEGTLRSILLPVLAAQAREAGVPDSRVRATLEEMRRRGLPARDAEPAMRGEVSAVRAGAPPGEFGSFVRRQLDAGLRGEDLAEAIHAELRARGIPAGGPEERGRRSVDPETIRRGPPEGVGRPGAAAGQPGRPSSVDRDTVRTGAPRGVGRPATEPQQRGRPPAVDRDTPRSGGR